VEPLLSVTVFPAPLALIVAMTTSPESRVNPCVMLGLPLPASVLTVAIREMVTAGLV